MIKQDKPSRCIIAAIMLPHPGKFAASCSPSRCGEIARTMQKNFPFAAPISDASPQIKTSPIEA